MRKLFGLSAVQADNEPIFEQEIMLVIDNAHKKRRASDIESQERGSDMG